MPRFTLTLLIMLPAMLPIAQIAAAAAPVATPVIETTGGPLQGLVENGVAVFKGIPYGAPPTGTQRFKPPVPPQRWTTVLPATGFGAPAMQLYDRPLNGSDLSLQLATVFTTRDDMKIDNEDALFLNVWTPELDDAKRPVMVWLHGGGYAYGSGAWPIYDGTNLANRGDVVVVTVNHRLNAFGYLYLAELLGEDYAESGNVGMLDIVLALEWVRDNIARFGGDPGNVTIMGESGGGSKVSTLLAMPAAEGLFHKAIIQSGPGLTGVSRADAQAATRAVVAELGLDPAEPALVRTGLETLPADELLAAVSAVQARQGGGFGRLRLAPVVDGVVLPRDPFVPDAPARSKDVPVMIGWNKDEMTLFNTSADWFGTLTEAELPARFEALGGDQGGALLAAYRSLYPDYTPTYLYNALLGDSRMFRGSVILAERKAAQNGAPVYVYYLTWETPVGNGIFKSPHTLDIPFMFANVDKAVALTSDSPQARLLETQMSSAWVAFARTGDPNNPALPHWPAYDDELRAVMTFDAEPAVANDPKGTIRQLLDAN
jgi:para-nitrobenzyl esterase